MQVARVGEVPCGLHLGIGPCKNGCVYCYAEGQSQSETLSALANQISKSYNGTLLSKWIERRVPVMVNNRSDLFNNVEPDLTMAKIDLLRDAGFPMFFETKGPHTAAQAKWFFDGMKKHEAIYLTVTTLDDEKRKVIEPHAPSVQQRFDFIREIVARGRMLIVGINPSIRDYADEALLDALYEAGVRDFYIFPIHLKSWGYRKEWFKALKPAPFEDFFMGWFDAHPDCTCDSLYYRKNEYPRSIEKLRAALGPASHFLPVGSDVEKILIDTWKTLTPAPVSPSIFRGMTPGEIVEKLPMRSTMDFMVKRSDIMPNGFAKKLNLASYPEKFPFYKLVELQLDDPVAIAGVGGYTLAAWEYVKNIEGASNEVKCNILWWPPYDEQLEEYGWVWTPQTRE